MCTVHMITDIFSLEMGNNLNDKSNFTRKMIQILPHCYQN